MATGNLDEVASVSIFVPVMLLEKRRPEMTA
jgi:hypothetical protein